MHGDTVVSGYGYTRGSKGFALLRFCTIFFGRLLAQCTPDVMGPLLVVWPRTTRVTWQTCLLAT